MTRALVIAPLAFVVGVMSLAAQRQTPQFRSGVERVRVDALVADRGRPILGLTVADFEVKDNGAIVRDLEVTPTSASVGVVIALSLGASAREAGLKELIAACQALAGALEPNDRAWIVTFSSTFALKAGPVTDPGVIRKVLTDAQPGSSSVMRDALFGSVSLAAAHPGRSLVLLFTDGVDRGSWLRGERALDVLRRSDVVVSGIRPAGVLFGFNALEALAKASGGGVIYAERGAKLQQQFVNLLREFRIGYVLSYAPPVQPAENGWHEIDVKLKGRRGNVRAREGYYEPGR